MAPSEPVSQPLGLTGFNAASLAALVERRGERSVTAQERYDALARYEELPARGPARGRYWKRDLASLDLSGQRPPGAETQADLYAPVGPLAGNIVYTQIDGASTCDARGGMVEAFDGASDRRAEALSAARGRALDTRDDKFASLALAFQHGGVFVDVPPGRRVEEPLVLAYEAREQAIFPYTLVRVGAGASATVVERLRTGAGTSPHAPFLGPLCELVVEEGGTLTYVVLQEAGSDATVIATRRGVVERGGTLAFAVADLGGGLSLDRVRITAAGRNARIDVGGIFFADGDQHVDLETETRHDSPETRSVTVVRTAATERGQGRYLGNIHIAEHANASDASLRDDALLLGRKAHIESIPALEIASNDVKAFHGATVGSIDDDEIFYAQSRGISRAEAERMIALGFFEPALASFPMDELRDHLRREIARKLEGAA